MRQVLNILKELDKPESTIYTHEDVAAMRRLTCEAVKAYDRLCGRPSLIDPASIAGVTLPNGAGSPLLPPAVAVQVNGLLYLAHRGLVDVWILRHRRLRNVEPGSRVSSLTMATTKRTTTKRTTRTITRKARPRRWTRRGTIRMRGTSPVMELP
jgi:hypothetical protein